MCVGMRGPRASFAGAFPSSPFLGGYDAPLHGALGQGGASVCKLDRSFGVLCLELGELPIL
jgi:hypothetical protein